MQASPSGRRATTLGRVTWTPQNMWPPSPRTSRTRGWPPGAAVSVDVDRAPGDRVGDPADHHGAEDAGVGGVGGEQRGQVDVEDQLAVHRHERLVAAVGIEQREGVLEAAAGAEQDVLGAVDDAGAERRAVAQLALDDVAAVVDVDDDVADAVGDELGEAEAQDRQVAHRQHRLGALVGQRAQAGTLAGAQQHRSGHGGTIARVDRGGEFAAGRGSRDQCNGGIVVLRDG
jgi:hypothetical protein